MNEETVSARRGRPLHVVHILFSFGTGGLEKGVATLARNASSDLRHTILCLAGEGDSRQLLPATTRVVEMGKRPGHSFSFLWRLSRTLKRLGPDVVHTRNWGGMDGVVAARLAGLRCVVHGEHGWVMEDPFGRDERRIRIRRFLRRWVREYTCVSKQMVEWLVGTVLVDRPVTQIYNGVDGELYRPVDDAQRTRSELSVPHAAFVVGILGRLDPIKDHATLFDAFERFRSRRPDARLLVVGEGPERSKLEALAGAGVSFLGNRLDAPAILRALDVFVLPSLNEGISNTILEAMASGNPELVLDGVTGTLIPPRDPATLAACLWRYASEPELRRRHGAAGRARVVEAFGVSEMVARYEAVYRRVAAREGRR
jgi:sugar transferase (PEP-CTERM/EpsH1 system associated)